MGEDFPATVAVRAGVDGSNHALAAEFAGRFGDQFRPGDGGGVDAAFVGTCQQ